MLLLGAEDQRDAQSRGAAASPGRAGRCRHRRGHARLVGDLFEYCDLGAVEVKGIAGPVPAWQVLRPSVVASRFEALRGSALTRLVGRGEEIDLLLRRWARAKAGDGQVVLISGEHNQSRGGITASAARILNPWAMDESSRCIILPPCGRGHGFDNRRVLARGADQAEICG